MSGRANTVFLWLQEPAIPPNLILGLIHFRCKPHKMDQIRDPGLHKLRARLRLCTYRSRKQRYACTKIRARY